MNMQETGAVLKILKASYPQFYKQLTKEEAYDVLDLWYMMFENEDVRVVTQAVKLLIKTHVYPPTIADVQNKIDLLTKKDEDLSEMEAWNLVYKAICNSSYNAENEYNKLPFLIQKTVGSPKQLREWGQMEGDSVQSVVQSNFMRSYKSNLTRHKEFAKIPDQMRKYIEDLKNSKRITEGTQDEQL